MGSQLLQLHLIRAAALGQVVLWGALKAVLGAWLLGLRTCGHPAELVVLGVQADPAKDGKQPLPPNLIGTSEALGDRLWAGLTRIRVEG